MIRTVLYISETTSPGGQTLVEQVNKIADTSAANNKKKGITGVLAYDERHFLHIIEGESPVLDELLQKIALDRRNKNFQVMFDVTWTNRIFQDWEALDQASDDLRERFNQFLRINIDALALLDDSQFEILSKFVENVFH